MIFFSELRDIYVCYVCYRLMVTMMEVIEERTYSAKHVTLSLMTSFEIDSIMCPRIWNITSIGNCTRNLNLSSDPGALWEKMKKCWFQRGGCPCSVDDGTMLCTLKILFSAEEKKSMSKEARYGTFLQGFYSRKCMAIFNIRKCKTLTLYNFWLKTDGGFLPVPRKLRENGKTSDFFGEMCLIFIV